MANYRYLGYGITNEQGIATLDHDANGNPIDHSYTGTGAGELDIIASLDDSTKISDSSIQSEPYEVWDTVFYDPLTSTLLNSKWYNTGALQVDADSTGTEFTNNESTNQYLLITDGIGGGWSNTYDWDNNYKYSFEIVSYTGNVYYKRGTDGGNEKITSTGNVTVEITSTSKIQAGFMMPPNAKLKIKNVKLYLK